MPVEWLEESKSSTGGVEWLEEPAKVEHPNLGDQSTEVPLLTKIGAKAYDLIGGPLYGLSRMFPTTAIPDALQGINQGITKITGGPQTPDVRDVIKTPIVPRETAQKAVEFMTPGGRQPEGSAGLGAQQFLADLASGMTSPEAITTLAAGKVSPQIPAFGFGVPMAQGIAPSVEEMLNAPDTTGQVRAGLGALLGTVGPIGLGRGAVEGPKPSGLTREDYPNFGRVSSNEQLVRESQGPIPIIGGEPKPSIVKGIEWLPSEELETSNVPTKPPVEPSGGEISFRSPAEAKGIPSARQSAQEHPTIGEQNATRIRSNERSIQSEGLLRQGSQDVGGQDIQLPEKEGTGAGEQIQRQGEEVKPQTAGDKRIQEAKLEQAAYAFTLDSPKYNPAIKTRSGEIVKGASHEKAWDEVDQRGLGKGTPGYVDKEGKFYTLLDVARAEMLKPLKEKEIKPPTTPLYSIQGLMFDPEFYKRTAKGVKELAGKATEYLKGAQDYILPQIEFKTDKLLARYQPKDVANRIAAQPYGTEKIPILGRIMGGKARVRTPQDAAVAALMNEFHGVGPSQAAFHGELVRGRISKEFKTVEKGPNAGDLNVRPTQPGQSLKQGDVIEGLMRDPNSYILTPKQRQVFNEIIAPVLKDKAAFATEYGVVKNPKEDYWSRTVTKFPKEDRPPGGQPSMLKRVTAQHERKFDTEAQGRKAGYEYETDIEKNFVNSIKNTYQAAAMARFVRDPVLQARSPKKVESDLRELYSTELASGQMSEKSFKNILESKLKAGRVDEPLLYNKIFPPEVAKMLNKEFGEESSKLRRIAQTVGSFTKEVRLGFDVGVGQIQLQGVMLSNPIVWGKMHYEAAKALATPQAFANFVRKHKDTVDIAAQLGSSIGHVQDFMVGSPSEGPAVRFPKIVGEKIGELVGAPKAGKYIIGAPGYAYEAFQRHFQASMDTAKILLLEAGLEGKPKNEWPRIMREVESTILSGRTLSAMVGKGRNLLDSNLWLAPQYYRGFVDSMAEAVLNWKGEKGQFQPINTARKNLIKFTVGMSTVYYAVGRYMLGMSDDELKKRMIPTSGNFFDWQVRMQDGRVVNFGFGGLHRAVLKLMGSVWTAKPEDWKSFDKNPMLRFWRSHAAPIPAEAVNVIQGKDYIGQPSDLTSIPGNMLPYVAEGLTRGKDQIPPTSLEYAANLTGMRARPENFTNRRNRIMGETAEREYGKPFEEVRLSERRKVTKEVNKQLQGEPTGISEKKSREISLMKEDERHEALLKGINQEGRKWAENQKLKISGYETSMRLGGVQVGFTEAEREKLQKAMIEEYNKVIMGRMNQPGWTEKDLDRKQRELNARLEMARKRAVASVRRGIGKGGE